MRAHLLDTFRGNVVDLHGDVKRGDADENIQIQQGVAIGVFIRRTGPLSIGIVGALYYLRGPARRLKAVES
jgi:hypothetical protein